LRPGEFFPFAPEKGTPRDVHPLLHWERTPPSRIDNPPFSRRAVFFFFFFETRMCPSTEGSHRVRDIVEYSSDVRPPPPQQSWGPVFSPNTCGPSTACDVVLRPAGPPQFHRAGTLPPPAPRRPAAPSTGICLHPRPEVPKKSSFFGFLGSSGVFFVCAYPPGNAGFLEAFKRTFAGRQVLVYVTSATVFGINGVSAEEVKTAVMIGVPLVTGSGRCIAPLRTLSNIAAWKIPNVGFRN